MLVWEYRFQLKGFSRPSLHVGLWHWGFLPESLDSPADLVEIDHGPRFWVCRVYTSLDIWWWSQAVVYIRRYESKWCVSGTRRYWWRALARRIMKRLKYAASKLVLLLMSCPCPLKSSLDVSRCEVKWCDVLNIAGLTLSLSVNNSSSNWHNH